MDLFGTSSLVSDSGIAYADRRFPEGRTGFLCGPSGCGKSTLLRMFNATRDPKSGRVFYRGRDIAAFDALELRRSVVLAGQEVFLFPVSILENFRMFYDCLGRPAPDGSHMERMLETCRLPFGLDADCAQLSGGEKQRVFLALSLSLEPDALLLDEPTGALDGSLAGDLMASVLSHCRAHGTTALVVTHAEELASRFGDYVVRWEAPHGA